MALEDDLGLETFIGGAPDEFVKAADMQAGQSISGIYLGMYWQTYAGDKVFDRPSQVHRILSPEHRILGISAGALNKDLTPAVVGSFVKLTYEGKSIIATGKQAGKEAHNFKFEKASKDNSKTLEMKAFAKTIPVYAEPPMPALGAPLPPGEALGGGLADGVIFAEENMPLLG